MKKKLQVFVSEIPEQIHPLNNKTVQISIVLWETTGQIEIYNIFENSSFTKLNWGIRGHVSCPQKRRNERVGGKTT